MRNRAPDSTTSSSLPSADFPTCPVPGNASESDSWVWFVTEKGLRACGATSMRAAAAELRGTAAELEKAARRLDQGMPAPSNGSGAETPDLGATPPLIFRRLTVCGQYEKEHQVPALRLSGKWLRQAGFDSGRESRSRLTSAG